MPNDALISTLDQLRERYSQRQRATNAVMGALKGMTGALSKASRTLKDYADQRSTALEDAYSTSTPTIRLIGCWMSSGKG